MLSNYLLREVEMAPYNYGGFLGTEQFKARI